MFRGKINLRRPVGESYPGQFHLRWKHSKDCLSQPNKTFVLDRMILSVFDGLEAGLITTKNGIVVGAYLGDLVDQDARQLIRGDILISIDPAHARLEQYAEEFIETHAGSYILILDHAGLSRVYLDANGTRSAVYSTEKQQVAATTGLILDDNEYRERFNETLYRHLDIPNDGWFPGGLTAHTGIKRLLCNHYLDLSDWRQHRHWPNEPIEIAPNPLEAVIHIADNTRTTIETLISTSACANTLTGGNETRFLLAACKGIEHQLKFVTVDNKETKLDVDIASKISAKHELKHQALPTQLAAPESAMLWHYRASHCIGGSNMFSHPTIDAIADCDYLIGGLGGEVGRAFLWKADDTPETSLTPESITYRFGMPYSDLVRDAVAEWLGVLEDHNTLQILDLAYLELRMSCWAFSQSYSYSSVTGIHPLISRSNFRLMLSLPADWRCNNLMILEGIGALWPELLEIPINRYGDYRDTIRLVSRALRHPTLITKKLRKKLLS